jgi:hypothetical protein
MFTEAATKTGVVTVIDNYTDANNQPHEARINVTAIVPDIPPDPPPWLYYYPAKLPYAFFQGDLSLINSNTPSLQTNLNGLYDFTLQIVHAPTNGLAVSQVVTQTVPVVNGLFNLPLPFDPIAMGSDGSAHWLNIGVRPSNLPAVQFTPIGPPLPIAPAPQAYYAFTAGSVSDLTPGQAVTSLNGLTDAVQLQSGTGIILGTNGNALTISTQPGVASDRNLKTDFGSVRPEDILARVTALSIQSWRYTNELSGVHHVGPMAQDFRAAFGLGTDDKFIYFTDESGVALAAIQGLNGKLAEKETEIQDLKQQLEALRVSIKQLETPQAK